MYDLIIIGGGINGCALARLAARHHHKVLLLEKHDLARGASGNSSKLIHGGLRYLENFDFPMVTESLNERAVQLQTAPHLVQEKEFLFPIFKRGRQGKLKTKIGLWLYDSLDKSKRFKPHQWLKKEAILESNPHFGQKDLLGAFSYGDAQGNDTRMVLENAVDAMSFGAEIKTYCEWRDIKKEHNNIAVFYQDRLSGNHEKILGKKVAFCTGAWSNTLLRKKNPSLPPPVLPSQGTHLYIKGLEHKDFFILPVPNSKRYFFVMPWLEGSLVGTTEHPPHPEDDLIEAFPEEIDELQSLVMRYFPESRPQGICTFSGVRPIVRSSQANSIKASRKHRCFEIAPGVGALLGGKFTTHRLMAEHFFQFLGFDLHLPLENIPLPGAENWEEFKVQNVPQGKNIPLNIWEEWRSRYGVRALEILEYIHPERTNLIDLVVAEATFSKAKELCRTPIDFFRRRSNLFFSETAGLEFFDAVEQLFDPSPQGNWRTHYEHLLKQSNHCALKNRP